MPKVDDRTVEQAVNGDSGSLAALLRDVGPRIKEHLRIGPLWQSVIDPEDVIQVTLLEAFLRIKRLQPPTVGAFEAWLARIADNNLRDAIRGLERQKRPDPRRRVASHQSADSELRLLEHLGFTSTTPSRQAAQKEAGILLQEAVARLPESYAAVVRMYDLDGHTIDDVSAQLGRSAGAVYMLRARAHHRLEELLGQSSLFFSKKP
jgi:RNA polymerase sigma factor (sigma-70 family)